MDEARSEKRRAELEMENSTMLQLARTKKRFDVLMKSKRKIKGLEKTQ